MDNNKSMPLRTHVESSPFPVPLILKRTEGLRKAAPFVPTEVVQEPKNYYLVDVNMWELLHHNYFKRLASAPASFASTPTPVVKPVPRRLPGSNDNFNSNESNRSIRPRMQPDFCFRPSLPTEFNFRPIAPADFNFRPGLSSEVGFRSSLPTEFNFRPSLSTEFVFRPSLPTELNFRPSSNTKLTSRPTLPTELNFRPSLPAELNFRPSSLPGSNTFEEKCEVNQAVTKKSTSRLSPAIPVFSEKRPSTVASKSKKAKSPRKRKPSEPQSPVSRKKYVSSCKLSHHIQPVCLNKVFQNESIARKSKDSSRSTKSVEHNRRTGPKRSGAKRIIFRESEYLREYRSEEELQSKFRGIQYYLFDELEVKEAIAETITTVVNT